jgi:hypothetical protein
MYIILLLFLLVVAAALMAYGLACLNPNKKPDKANVLTKSDNTSEQRNDPVQQEQLPPSQPINTLQVQRLQYFCIKDKGYHVSVWPKDQGIGDYLEFPIAGITHGEHIDEHLGEFTATLEPDPTNPYDQNAIKIVTSEGHRVGYVPKGQTAYVRDFTTLPCRCYCYIGNNDGHYFTDCYITRNDQ